MSPRMGMPSPESRSHQAVNLKVPVDHLICYAVSANAMIMIVATVSIDARWQYLFWTGEMGEMGDSRDRRDRRDGRETAETGETAEMGETKDGEDSRDGGNSAGDELGERAMLG
ncbi:hypothetical protein CY34DRAFT_110443 [Suillus luteus UH-Slu-Lm8-n1]|uniref:Uncharacterized protein n=1 Tax=Suillus luteus UH-Slu-Lm8-n1 TaxID=930992 RepID=A0A0D0AIH5_9AGAM|nr:hypothetical protein CY34DRAFT_110443 [Suillus luteus UH-Slu-Lm8-n1]